MMFFSFSPDKKTNKKVKAVRCRVLRRRKFSYNELPEGRVINPKGKKFKTPLRAMRGF